MEWHNYPAVTTGGKRFFYRLMNDGQCHASVVWNRAIRAYAVEVRLSMTGRYRLVEYVSNVHKGKRIAEDTLFSPCKG